ncbi:MAG TPA: energy transducer TonB [Pyrinomonadaceae bacterium]
MKIRKPVLFATLSALAALFVLYGLAPSSAGQSEHSPKVVAAATPFYPPIAMAARAAGVVVVEVTVGADGKVLSAAASSGHPLLQHAGVLAARRWKFEPAVDGSRARTAKLTFTFRLNEEKRPLQEITPVFMPPYKVEIVGDSSGLIQVETP